MISQKMQDRGLVTRFVAPSTPESEEAEKEMLKFAKRVPRRLLSSSAWRSTIRQVPSDAVSFFHDVPGAKSSKTGATPEILAAIRGAQREIVIENPYIVLTKEMREVLAERKAAGVKIIAYSNSSKSIEAGITGKLVSNAWGESRDFLVSLSADIWEHGGDVPSGSDFAADSVTKTLRQSAARGLRRLKVLLKSLQGLHAKTLVIDGEMAIVSSYNMDGRSQNINMETGVVVRDREFAQDLLLQQERDRREQNYHLVYKNGELVGDAPECSRLYRILGRAVSGYL